jgi:hypothetical protein
LLQCFAAGTPLLTPDGEKNIEEFKPGDWVLSAPEFDPEAPPEPRQVEEVFTNFLPLLNVQVRSQTIRTTQEHPFYVRGKGWTAAKDLQPGDLLRSHDGQWIAVKTVFAGAELAPVYNMRVADYHTYFVGSSEWDFSVWAHNTCAGLNHYVPRFMGSLVPRGSPILTFFRQIGHIAFHRALNRFLAPLGMAPSRANTGAQIIRNFSQTDRLKALVQFYKEYQGGAHFQGFMDELRQTIRLGLFQ